jgi:quercetin dioxygenase-like cupin family protein
MTLASVPAKRGILMYEAGGKIQDSATGKRRYYHPAQKDPATFLQTSEETGGERTLVEVAPGGGTPPHYHKTYDEHFEVLEGVLELRVGGDTRNLHAGQKALAPKNTLHKLSHPHGRADQVPGRVLESPS